MSFYTKYRPQTVAELDLDKVRRELNKILTSGMFSHAYLFTGPKGTGKTSSARILAKVLNCEKNKSKTGSFEEPCNECDNCRRITNGSSLACMEMDAASNRGIDDIRTLRERIGLTPAEGSYTVYIIDEVHMLTTEAFNALLKTLEEPPEHAVFILCTTDAQKIPETVVSRCTRILFQKATVAEVERSLSKAVKGEKLTVEDGVLAAIAGQVDGSFRDGMKLLEQLAQAKETITLALVNEAVGVGGDYAVDRLVQALLHRDVQVALDELHQRQDNGVDISTYTRRLVEHLRGQLLLTVQNQTKNSDVWLGLTRCMSEAAVKIKQSVIPVLPLEIAIAEWCLSTDKVGESSKFKLQITNQAQNLKPPEIIKKPNVVASEEPVLNEPRPVMGAYEGTLDTIAIKWQEILAAIKPLNHSLEALLRSAKPTEYADGWLTVEAFYKFHKEQLEQDRYRRKLEETMSDVLGGSVCLRFVLSDREDQVLVEAAEEIFGK